MPPVAEGICLGCCCHPCPGDTGAGRGGNGKKDTPEATDSFSPGLGLYSLLPLGDFGCSVWRQGKADLSKHRGSAPWVAAPLPPALTSFPTPSPGAASLGGASYPSTGCSEMQRSGGSSPARESQRCERELGRQPLDINPLPGHPAGSACFTEPSSPKERPGLWSDFKGKGPCQPG